MRITRPWLVWLPLVVASACSAPAMPPHMGFSRHLAPIEDESGEVESTRLGFSTGALLLTQEEDEDLLILFPTEGFISFFGQRYSASFAAGHFLGSYEGDLLLVNRRSVRVGLLHGLGLGYQRSSPEVGDAESALFYDLSAGLMVEVRSGESGKAFLGFRYTLADVSEEPDDDFFQRTDYLTFGGGVHFRVGRVDVTPELLFSRATWKEPDFSGPATETTKYLNYFIPGIAVSVPF